MAAGANWGYVVDERICRKILSPDKTVYAFMANVGGNTDAYVRRSGKDVLPVYTDYSFPRSVYSRLLAQ